MVQTDGNGFKSVDYPHLTAVLLEAVKELKAENTQLAQTAALVQSLDAKLTSLAGAVKVLTARNAALPTSGTATTILVPAVGPASSSVTAAGSAH